MYPYFIFFWYKIYFVSLWILLSLVIYLILVYKFSKKYQLNFIKYFAYFPYVFILTYLLWVYFYSIIELKDFIPDIKTLIYLIIPSNYSFNFIWLSIGFLLSHLFFLSKVSKIEKKQWIDVIFYPFIISVSVFWIFLQLGDNFIWRPTDSSIWVSLLKICYSNNCFSPESKLQNFVKVYPVWFILSLISIFSLIIALSIAFIRAKWSWYYWFIIFLILINIPFLYQNYPRYLVVKIQDYRFDIKNYWTLILIIILTIYYRRW